MICFQKDIVMKPFDAALMTPMSKLPVTIKLDGEELGRGVRWAEDMQGFTKEKVCLILLNKCGLDELFTLQK